MRNFSSPGEFAAHLKALIKIKERALLVTSETCGKIVQESAREKIGFYQPQVGPFDGWAELSPFTKHDRLQHGFTENDPLLRTGELRESISYTVAHQMPWLYLVVVGSPLEYAEYQEVGTSRIPPRAFLGPALFENKDVILHVTGVTMEKWLRGKGPIPGA